jgi:hypothetical protein
LLCTFSSFTPPHFEAIMVEDASAPAKDWERASNF